MNELLMNLQIVMSYDVKMSTKTKKKTLAPRSPRPSAGYFKKGDLVMFVDHDYLWNKNDQGWLENGTVECGDVGILIDVLPGPNPFCEYDDVLVLSSSGTVGVIDVQQVSKIK